MRPVQTRTAARELRLALERPAEAVIDWLFQNPDLGESMKFILAIAIVALMCLPADAGLLQRIRNRNHRPAMKTISVLKRPITICHGGHCSTRP